MRAVSITILLLITLVAPASAQWVYMSSNPQWCSTGWDAPTTLYVYAHSGSEVTIGVTFRVQDDLYGDVLSVTPEPGVTILRGDLFSGMTLSWSPRTFDHDPILVLETNFGFSGEATTTDVLFFQPAGAFPGEDVSTVINSFPHCQTSWAGWQVPDTVEVRIDATTGLTIKAIVHTEQPYEGALSVVDAEGWVIGPSPNVIPIACWACPWDWGVMDIAFSVPDTVAPQTLNTITLQCNFLGQVIDEVDVVLRAVDPVAVEATSFGRLKTMYRKKASGNK